MNRNVCSNRMQDIRGDLIDYWIKWSENVYGTQQKLQLKLQSFIIIVSRRLTASPKVHSTCWRMNLIHSRDDSAVEILLSFSINGSWALSAFFHLGKFNLVCVCHLHSNLSQFLTETDVRGNETDLHQNGMPVAWFFVESWVDDSNAKYLSKLS